MLEVKGLFDSRNTVLTIQDLIDSRIVSVDEETAVEEACDVGGHILSTTTHRSYSFLYSFFYQRISTVF